MSTVSDVYSDFASNDAPLKTMSPVERLAGRRRLIGWTSAAVLSLGLWGAIVAGVVALIHAF